MHLVFQNVILFLRGLYVIVTCCCRIVISYRFQLPFASKISFCYVTTTKVLYKLTGQQITVHITMTYKGISSDMPMQLTREDRSTCVSSILRTMNRLLGMSDSIWSREHHQFSRYTDLLVRLREDTCLLLYSYTGTLVSIPMFCRTVEEADEIWQRYQSGELEKEIRELFSGMYLPFGPMDITVKIYDYEECKRNFQFAG